MLASANGGLPEIVVEGQTGRLLPPGDIAAWTKVIGELCIDPQQLQRMGQSGRERAEASFTWAANAARLEAMFS